MNFIEEGNRELVRRLSIRIHSPLPHAYACPRSPLNAQLLHLHRLALERLVATFISVRSAIVALQFAIIFCPVDVSYKVPPIIAIYVANAWWSHVTR